MKNLLLIPVLFLFTGCASGLLKTGCGHLTGSEMTVPYAGGKASGNVYGCYMGYVGFKGPKADPQALASIMTAYLQNASKDNTIRTNDGGMITYTPSSK